MAEFRIGTSGWNYPSWRYHFYPSDCPQSKWLEYYSQFFNTVELNATFYRFFTNEHYLNWYKRVPENFKFVVKVPGYITHRKQLLDAEQQTKQFIQHSSYLGKKLGLRLLQLAPRTSYHFDRLNEKLQLFGKESSRLAVEFRNTSWLNEEVFELLSKYHAVFCNVDSPSVCLQTIVTSRTSYIRLHGRKAMYNYNYSKHELTEIADQARELEQQGARLIYIFFNNDVNANSIKNALTLKAMLTPI